MKKYIFLNFVFIRVKCIYNYLFLFWLFGHQFPFLSLLFSIYEIISNIVRGYYATLGRDIFSGHKILLL